MKQEDRIDTGSIVNVSFTSSSFIPEAVVLGTPADTGDAWKLMMPNGTVVYVQSYERMDKIKDD